MQRTASPLIEVDRVASVSEARAFCQAGAGLIGVALDRDPRFDDQRAVDPATARAIKQEIRPAKLVGIIPTVFDEPRRASLAASLDRLLAVGPDYLHIGRGLPDELIATLLASGVPIVWDGAEVGEDQGMFLDLDDPAAFVRRQISLLEAVRPTIIHLDIAAGEAEPWTFLSQDAPSWPDEAPQIEQIARITRDLPIMLAMTDVGADHMGEFARAFPDAIGFFARLGPADRGYPSMRPEALLAQLPALTGSFMPARA